MEFMMNNTIQASSPRPTDKYVKTVNLYDASQICHGKLNMGGSWKYGHNNIGSQVDVIMPYLSVELIWPETARQKNNGCWNSNDFPPARNCMCSLCLVMKQQTDQSKLHKLKIWSGHFADIRKYGRDNMGKWPYLQTMWWICNGGWPCRQICDGQEDYLGHWRQTNLIG